MPSRFDDVFAALAETLGRLGVRFYLFGAQAALFYGSTRLTADVDITVDLGEHGPEALVDELERAGFRARVPGADFVRKTRVLPVEHVASGIAVDVVLAGRGIEDLFFERCQVRNLGGVSFPVASAEDIIVMKLLSGRSKDVEDVVAMLAANSDLDVALIKETLSLLEKALDQSDLLPALANALGQVRRSTRARPPKVHRRAPRPKTRRGKK